MFYERQAGLSTPFIGLAISSSWATPPVMWIFTPYDSHRDLRLFLNAILYSRDQALRAGRSHGLWVGLEGDRVEDRACLSSRTRERFSAQKHGLKGRRMKELPAGELVNPEESTPACAHTHCAHTLPYAGTRADAHVCTPVHTCTSTDTNPDADPNTHMTHLPTERTELLATRHLEK